MFFGRDGDEQRSDASHTAYTASHSPAGKPYPGAVPPPAQPPVINGPLSQPSSPRVYQAPQLGSSSPRINSCLREGRKLGLRGKKLDAYTRECARPDEE